LKLNKLVSIFLFSTLTSPLIAQQNFEDKYSGYYMFPIRPGQENFLSGTMGELRANHFHAGIDIKTGGVEGLPVYAAADGYVSRINVSSVGYGNALYILHPNGTTTVYAHLKDFKDDIADFVRQNQYKSKSFEIEIYPEKDKFPVKKGDIIAKSGNSGSSGGPHLHFEIRDKNQDLLNPLSFGFKEIKDNTPPIVEKVALRTLDKDSRINNQFGRFIFDVVKKGNEYIIPSTIHAYGNIGIEILGYDRLNNSANKTGIQCIEAKMNGEEFFYQKIQTFSFAETRNILVHYDYPTVKTTGQKFSKLFVADGNPLPFYKSQNQGKVQIKDSLQHEMIINFWDTYQNSTKLSFVIQGQKPVREIKSKLFKPYSGTYEVMENTLILYGPTSLDKSLSQALLYTGRKQHTLSPDYKNHQADVYLWDLRRSLPDSAEINGAIYKFNFKVMVPSNKEINFFDRLAEIYFPSKALFDTLYLSLDYEFNAFHNKEIFYINDENIPLRQNIHITLKPEKGYAQMDKTFVYSIDDQGNYSFEGGNWNKNKIQFKTRGLGAFTLLTDSIPPSITPVKLTKDQVAFTIKDELSGIQSYKAFIDGDWLLMNYDRKRNYIWSDKLNSSLPLKGEFKLLVIDNAGNEKTFIHKL
jgi:hypothetical protein